MKYIGLDLHKKSIFATVLGEDGKILSKTKIGPNTRDICYYLKSQGKRDELSVAMEASYNWPYYYRAVEEAADNIVLAHPLKTRIIGEAKIKTDKIDSGVLAYMLKAVQYSYDWLKNINIDKIDGGSYRLLPMFFKKLIQLEDFNIESEILGKLEGIYRHYFFKNTLIILELSKTLKILHQSGIRIMLLKGIALVLGNYYKDYGLRPMNDVDIFVDKDKVEETIKLLTQFGWKEHLKISNSRSLSHFYSITLVKKSGYALDLHWHLLSQCCWDKIDSNLWKYANVINFKGVPLYLLSPADQILHNCAHGINWSKLPSFRWIIDVITIIDKHKDSINWQRLISESKRRFLTLTLFHTLQYIESIANNRVPNWVIDELHNTPVNKSEKILFKVLTKKSIRIRRSWVLHVNNNLDKSLLNNLMSFSLYIKEYIQKNYLKIPGFWVNKIFLLLGIRTI